jgi:hypothetical protein
VGRTATACDLRSRPRGILTYSYSIVPTTGQLLIRINFERVPEQPGPFDIKIVYNRSKES